MATIDGADGSSRPREIGRRLLDAIGSSVLVFVATLGVIFGVLGILVEAGIQLGLFGPLGREIWGIWAAIFVWWGAGLLGTGVVGRGIIWIRRRSYVSRAYGSLRSFVAPAIDGIRSFTARVRNRIPGL